MLGKILFLIFAIGSFACDEKCMLASRCYECVRDNISACVPVNNNVYGTLDNYMSWNCTLKTEESSTEKLIDDICKIDNFVDELCNITVGNDDNGFCMIASYINDICESKRDIKIEVHEKYVSPWGRDSECEDPDYVKLCSSQVTKYCYDCRIKLFINYKYSCFPIISDDKVTESFIQKEKYECRKWVNKHYKPSFTITNVESPNGLYPACTGSICLKEGWQFQKTDFGKDWCGLGQCKPYNRKYYCSFPTNCGKNTNEQFQTLGCGKEKFNCLLKKSCRQLLRRLDDCDKDQVCIFNLIVENAENDTFSNLVKCMV